ncbi:MAG: tripartite tricarboxylate transporter substrate binding protein [Pigmentiphaga sp.]|uniref:tripartite tricarboxylate transporter substrate binding protein n=1 Tax=Pigmentiphaga sp. TaxID=1977564 RepID=UPI0029A4E475|nr:tripartite tricarboxylate transporter substrate binding protein [Pigmentiphaga sp.]MDX3908052.1 tripartite tricarboxylate transporter substrate binding protein [Pigmentiphaga sp.]
MNSSFLAAGRLLAVAVALVMFVPAAARASEAAGWPNRLIKLVVPFPAGSMTDRIGRVIAQQLGASFGQSVVVENRPGAGATIGTDYVAKADPDGYTFLLGANAPLAVNVAFMKLPYDPVKSFEPVSLVATVPNVLLVGPKVQATTLRDLLALARANPGKLTYTSAGIGTVGHLGMEMLGSMADAQFLHIPAKGPVQALQDVAGGHVDILVDSIALSAPLIRDGRLRGLALTGTERSPAMPDLPTVSEAGVPRYELLLWFALFAPAGTPQPIVDKVHAATARAFADPAVRDPFTRDGVNIVAGTPQELAAFQRSEIDKFRKLISTLNLNLGQ